MNQTFTIGNKYPQHQQQQPQSHQYIPPTTPPYNTNTNDPSKLINPNLNKFIMKNNNNYGRFS